MQFYGFMIICKMKRDMRCKWRALFIHYKMTKSGGFGKSQASRDVLISECEIRIYAGIPLTLSHITLSIDVPSSNFKSFSGRGEIPHLWYVVAYMRPISLQVARTRVSTDLVRN